MPAYKAIHARHYDLIYAEKPYAAEAEFVANRFARAGVHPPARILDVACGTGRHALELARLGFSVTGIDLNPVLLGIARATAERSSMKIDFRVADMRSLPIGGEDRFDAATCLFDSLGYVGDDMAVLDTLRSIGACLVEGGVFVFEVLNAPAMIRNADVLRVRSWERPDGGELLRISSTDVDADTGSFVVDYRVLELRPDGTFSEERDRHCNRAFSVEEIQWFLDSTGYEQIGVAEAYDEEAKVNDDTWHLLVSARRQ
jgi:SAM-dependent methyltransferase